MNEEQLNNLSYADDVVAIAEISEDLKKMLVELEEKSQKLG